MHCRYKSDPWVVMDDDSDDESWPRLVLRHDALVVSSQQVRAQWYSLRLEARPRSSVVVSVEAESGLIGTAPKSLDFSESNWRSPQWVCVFAGLIEDKIFVVRHFVATDDRRRRATEADVRVHFADTACSFFASFGAQSHEGLLPKKTFEEKTVTDPGEERRRRLPERRRKKQQQGPFLQDESAFLEDMSSDSDADDDALQRYGPRRLSKEDGILGISAGIAHTLVLGSDGRVYALGKNSNGQLGVGDSQDRRVATPVIFDEEIPEEETAKRIINGVAEAPAPAMANEAMAFFHSPANLIIIRSISCGSYHSAALTSAGRVFAWGDNFHGQVGISSTTQIVPCPSAVDSFGVVQMIACGGSHTLAATEDRLFAWGNGRSGALGLEESRGIARKPTEVLRNVKLIAISCGSLHSGIVSVEGKLLTCGSDDNWQLGRAGKHDVFLEVIVDRRVFVVSASCGGGHTLVATNGGDVYAFGDNASGQLGLGLEGARYKCRQVEALAGVDVRAVFAGYSTSAALTSCGRVFLWGQGSCGQLGGLLKKTGLLRLPRLAAQLSCRRVRHVALGGSHSLFLTQYAATFTTETTVPFARDARAHFRIARALVRGDEEKHEIRQRTWIKTYKVHKVLTQLRRDQILEQDLYAKVAKLQKRQKLTRILQKSTFDVKSHFGDALFDRSFARRKGDTSSEDHFLPLWVDRVAAHRKLQSRFIGGLYPSRRSEESLATKTLRLHIAYVLAYAGLLGALGIRGASRTMHGSFDWDLPKYVEVLLSSRRLGHLRPETSMPPPTRRLKAATRAAFTHRKKTATKKYDATKDELLFPSTTRQSPIIGNVMALSSAMASLAVSSAMASVDRTSVVSVDRNAAMLLSIVDGPQRSPMAQKRPLTSRRPRVPPLLSGLRPVLDRKTALHKHDERNREPLLLSNLPPEASQMRHDLFAESQYRAQVSKEKRAKSRLCRHRTSQFSRWLALRDACVQRRRQSSEDDEYIVALRPATARRSGRRPVSQVLVPVVSR